MIFIIATMYIWSGLTTAHALYQFEEIGESVNRLTKDDEKKLKRHMKGKPSVWLMVIVIWPLVMPLWIWQWRAHNA